MTAEDLAGFRLFNGCSEIVKRLALSLNWTVFQKLKMDGGVFNWKVLRLKFNSLRK